MSFAKPIGKYAVPYSIFTFLHAIFNMFNYVMIIPILDILFEGKGELVTVRPEFSWSLVSYLKEALSYNVYRIFGADYDVMQVLLLLAVVLVAASMFSNLFRYLGQRTMENMKIYTLQNLRNATFDNVMNLNVGFFTNERKGDVISKITSDVQVVQFCVSSTLQAVFRDPFLIISYLFLMITISWQLTVFAVLYLPVVALLIGTIVKKLRRKATTGQEKFADMVSVVDESVSGVKMINAYGVSGYVKSKFHDINNLYSRVMRSMARRQQLASPMSEFLGVTAMSVLLLFGGKLVMDGSLAGSGFIGYLAVFSQITRPMRSFTDAFSNINQGIAAGERVLTLLDTPSTIVDKPDAIELKDFEKDIIFKDVRFSYDCKEVIKGINLDIHKGQTVALVGGSGGGKTTISDLIPRFYDVQEGSISVDGHDIRDCKMRSLRERIGVVSQDTVLFNDTIEGNIRMGKMDAAMEEIMAAARVANAHDFIMETENGYQTNIGDRGMKLSGGQRQRLSIARAILKNPDILILDEATSALDTESEKLVQQALDTLLVGRTSIVIAHRLSTVYNADKICVVEQGQIVEEGTHDELMKLDGVYHKLVSMQNMV